jgi:hypothetical protein
LQKQEFPGIQIILANQLAAGSHLNDGVNSYIPPTSSPISSTSGVNVELGTNSSSNPISNGQDLARNGRPQTPPSLINNI